MSDTPSAGYGSGGFGGYGGQPGYDDQTLALQQISLNTRILRETNPWMGDRPDIMMNLATSGIDPGTLAQQGAALYGMQSLDALRGSLERLTGPAQRSVYNRLTDQQQRALDQMGYNTPDSGGNFLGPVGEVAGVALSPLVKGVSTVAGPPLRGALDVLTWVGDQPAHLYRAIRLQDDWKQWAALGGAALGAAAVIGTGGGALALLPTLMAAGAIGGGALAGATATAAITGQGEWWDALNATWDGERVFEKGAQRRARDILQSDELMNMAKELALELDPYEFAVDLAETNGSQGALLKAVERVAGNLVDPSAPEYQQLFGGLVTLLEQEPFLEALDILQQGKISFGRDIGDLVGLDHSSGLYHLTSGMLDGAWAIAMDPTLIAGSISKLHRLQRYGITPEHMDNITQRLTQLSETSRSFRALEDTVITAVKNQDFTMMPRDWRGMYIPMTEWSRGYGGFETFDQVKFRQFFHEGAGMQHLLSGKGTIRGVEAVVLSTRNEQRGWGRFVRELRQFRDTADAPTLELNARRIAEKNGVGEQFEYMLPQDVLDESLDVNLNPAPGVVERAAGGIGSFIGSKVGYLNSKSPGVRSVGRMIQSLTTMAPTGQAMRIVGEGAEEDIPRVVEAIGVMLNWRADVRDEWLNFIMAQGAPNQRLMAMESFMDAAFSLGGMHSHPAMRELKDQFLHKFDQAYGVGGLDVSKNNGVEVMTGQLPALHQASFVVVPDIPEMLTAVRRGHLLKHVAKITDSDFVETAMSRFWKPSVLMRIGFIPRAAGEEGLAFLARMTEGGLAQEFGARGVAQRRAYEEALAVKKLADEGRGRALEARELAALQWQVPSHVRPLQWMLSRNGWKDPVDGFLENYGIALRGHLATGLGRTIEPVTTKPGWFGIGQGSDQWYHGLLYGREHSWRRMLVQGIDRHLIDSANHWVNGHADAILMGTSAMNASDFEKSIVNPDVQVMMVEDPKNPGKLIEEPYITVRGERVRVYQGDPRYAAAIHHRLGEAFMDDVVAPMVGNMYPKFFPSFPDLQPQQIVAHVESFRQVESWTGRKILLEALQPRTDNWQAAAEVLRADEPLIAQAIDDVLFTGSVTLDKLVDAIGRILPGIPDPADGVRVRQVYDELQSVVDAVDSFSAFSPATQSWLAAGISADLSVNGGFYDLDALRGWANGDKRFIFKRPERVLYRGIKDMSTIEIRQNPEGGLDLVLKPQWNDDWKGQVISTSRIADQSLSYAASEGAFNSGGQYMSGAMIEFDADYALGQFGRTWDELDADPITYNDAFTSDRAGPQLIGHGIDDNEVAFVLSREKQQSAGSWTHSDPNLDYGNPDDVDRLATDLQYSAMSYTTMEDLLTKWRENLDLYTSGPYAGVPAAGTPATYDLWARILQAHADDLAAGGGAGSAVDAARIQASAELQAFTWNKATSGTTTIADELVIPAGHWAIQNEQQMADLVVQLQQGAPTRWDWLKTLKSEFPSGTTVESVQRELVAAVDAAQASGSTDSLYAWLVSKMDPSAPPPAKWWDPPNDDLGHLSRMLGFNIYGGSGNLETEIRKMADQLTKNPDWTDRMRQAIELRGKGGFQTELPRWAPFIEDRDEFIRHMKRTMHAELMRPQNAEWTRKSRWAMETSTGERVAHPLQEGVKRVYVPVHGRATPDYVTGSKGSVLSTAVAAVVDDASTTDELIELVVARLLADPRALRMHTRYIESIGVDAQAAALSEAVRATLSSPKTQVPAGEPFRIGPEVMLSGPLHGVAYDDPRVAQWVTDVLWGGQEPGRFGQYYLDIPRDRGDVQSGLDLGGAGSSWRVPQQRWGTTNHITNEGQVVLPDGTVHAGVSFEKALEDWADRIVQKVVLEHSRGLNEAYEVTERGAAELTRRRGDQFIPLQQGERLSHEQELFDPDGNVAPWARPEHMTPTAEAGDEFLWEIIGPMTRDFHEHMAGFTSRIPRSSAKTLKRWAEREEVPPLDQLVNMTRSRIDNVHSGVMGLPNVALSEVRKNTNNRLWDQIVRFGFDRVIGPSIDAIVRKPMSFHFYAAARRQNQQWLRFFIDRDLIDTRLPAVMSKPIAGMDELTMLNADQMKAARALAEFRDGAVGLDDVDTANFLASVGGNQREYLAEIHRAKDWLVRYPEMGFAPEVLDPLLKVDIGPIKLLGASGTGISNGERLTRAYYDAIPENIWKKGADSVNQFIARNELGLPVLATDEQWRTVKAARDNYAHVQYMLDEASKQRALENVVPFIDSHEQRSQFAAIGRNMVPFWYAEENFLKRWARTFAIDGTYGLATLRKAQLAYMGVRSAGLIRQDANGKDWFVYPGSGLLAEAINMLPFIPDTLPVGLMFQADVQQMMPGMNEKFGTPSFSPFIAFPISGVTTLFPDVQPVERALLGDIGASQGPLNQFVPTTVRRAWSAAFGDEDSSRRYAAAMMAAAAMMEAEGNGLPDSATPEQLEDYLDKLRNHARIVMWAQAVTGFVVPGAPIAINTGQDAPNISEGELGSFGWWSAAGVDSPDEMVSAQYRTYIQNLGIDEGTQRFLADFPNADLQDVIPGALTQDPLANPLAYSVPTSASTSGAPLPATQHGMAWYNQNQAWVDSMPEAGAWFLPRPETDDAFDFYSYNQQLQNNLRKQRNPADFIRALKYRNAASGYFEARDMYEQGAIALGDDQGRKRQLDFAWESWRNTWLAAHPIFAEELVSGEARERRARTITQLRYAVSDPQAPASPSLEPIREMSQNFDLYSTAYAQLGERRDAQAKEAKRMLREAWDQWAASWVIQNPELEQLWSAVYRPESNL